MSKREAMFIGWLIGVVMAAVAALAYLLNGPEQPPW
jgi:gas vesicle protein